MNKNKDELNRGGHKGFRFIIHYQKCLQNFNPILVFTVTSKGRGGESRHPSRFLLYFPFGPATEDNTDANTYLSGIMLSTSCMHYFIS